MVPYQGTGNMKAPHWYPPTPNGPFSPNFLVKGKVPATRQGRKEAGICIYSSQFCSLGIRQLACNKTKRKYNQTPRTSSETENTFCASKVLELKILHGNSSFWSLHWFADERFWLWLHIPITVDCWYELLYPDDTWYNRAFQKADVRPEKVNTLPLERLFVKLITENFL